jgi:hypothetical protein
MGDGGGEGNFTIASRPSTEGDAVLPTVNRFRICMISQSAAAPQNMRMKVKVAASMLVSFSAARQSSELLANAIIASNVSMRNRVGFTAEKIGTERFSENEV